jgi:L-ascorbate metabolism protein UlaG (beta-lactamase superfamily)
MPILWKLLKWRFGRAEPVPEPPRYVPDYVAPDLARIRNPAPDRIQITWVGHATFLVQMAGLNILTDPIWSARASPVRWAGPKRFSRPGLPFDALPAIDAVLVSHTHYDHLDRPTVLKLGNAPRYVVPERLAPWFNAEGITNVAELPWWRSATLGALNITAVPAKHWSKRWAFGHEDAGWGGFVIASPAGTLYFAGDTGYDDSHFKEIGERFPGIDVALIPIGAYHPREVFGRYHVDPQEAIRIHREVSAKRSIGMHWGAFKLTMEPLDEPPQLLAKDAAAAGMPPEEFSTMRIGETRVVV